MTILQELKEEVSEARQLMVLHRPNKGAIGNMYYYWQEKRDKALRKIKEIKNKLINTKILIQTSQDFFL